MLPMFIVNNHRNYSRELATFFLNMQCKWPQWFADLVRENMVQDGYACVITLRCRLTYG
jgi:hypothetical protein